MEIAPEIRIIDLALFVQSTLIISDVHIGYEEALNKQGVLVPRLQFEEMAKRMEKIFAQINDKSLDRVIINGDLKHEFGTISEQEWRNTLKFLDLLLKNAKEVILIKGNHDTILGPIASKRNVKLVENYIVEIAKKESINIKVNKKKMSLPSYLRLKSVPSEIKKILVCHGDKIPKVKILENVDYIIIGHEHPAVSLKEGARIETVKCFLKGRYDGKLLIVQPSFNNIIEGTDILSNKILSPFLKQNLDNFEIYAVEGEIYYFGRLRNLASKFKSY